MANPVETKNTKTSSIKTKGFLSGVVSEFKKVVWPTKKETVNYTLVVIVVSIAVSLFVYLLDFVFTKLLNLLIR
ncbi:preprotein translocase subunit SecE [Citroniella saccharovorans]|uniref:Protein translocase subunit SecE n=1 Tax=Citroniella saccharovorans TaxID=2053367 RepID=A0AAW9MV91_9FIRM|nr:preprotein translocase subunit SecE [Citroniella saccharovorans]MEB3430021.1 preprotein translocase subunit SecE [Citroniella saccharovorans]